MRRWPPSQPGRAPARRVDGGSTRGGEVPSGDLDEVVDATIEHGRRIHNMEASRDQVLAALGAGQPDEAADLSA